MERCKFCGKQAKLVKISGLYYVQCEGLGTRQCKHEPYMFLGIKETTAIQRWNEFNSKYLTISGPEK